MPSPYRSLVASIAAAAMCVSLGGCAAGQRPSAGASTPAPAPNRGQVVFDMGHGEVFSPQDTSDLGQSIAINQIRSAGFDVVVNNDLITPEDLKEASGLIIAGPMRSLQDSEYAAIQDFVRKGGTVLLTIHVPFPVLKVPAHWGLPVGTKIMMSKTPVSSQSPSIFVADKVSSDPLMTGVRQVLVLSGWPVGAVSDSARIEVQTRQDTWLTGVGDKEPTPPPGTKFGSYGVIGVASVGKGKVIVSGDDAVFANIAIGEYDNARLLGNIIDLMAKYQVM